MTSIDTLLELPDVRRLRAALGARPGVRIDNDDGTRRLAAIALVLRPGVGPATNADPELLMIKRAEAEGDPWSGHVRSEEHTSELQSPCNLVCRLLLEKKKKHQYI